MAAAAALASFKFALSEPIYLWSLGLVALGWAGALLHALAAGRRAAIASDAAAGHETRAVIDGLAQVMGAEVKRAGAELLRVDELLAHAVEQLMAAFSSLSDQVQRQQRQLAPGADGVQETPATERLRAAAESVARALHGAVTALQFRDVVGQKLGHVRQELETLEQVLQRVREVSAPPQEAAGGRARTPAPQDLAARVQDLLRELDLAKAASPAQQALMHAGEVDLF